MKNKIEREREREREREKQKDRESLSNCVLLGIKART